MANIGSRKQDLFKMIQLDLHSIGFSIDEVGEMTAGMYKKRNADSLHSLWQQLSVHKGDKQVCKALVEMAACGSTTYLGHCIKYEYKKALGGGSKMFCVYSPLGSYMMAFASMGETLTEIRLAVCGEFPIADSASEGSSNVTIIDDPVDITKQGKGERAQGNHYSSEAMIAIMMNLGMRECDAEALTRAIEYLPFEQVDVAYKALGVIKKGYSSKVTEAVLG